MADIYESVSVNNYNLNPPADDGTVSDANKITWAKHKQKLGDPLNTAIGAINDNVIAAMTRIIGGADVVLSAGDYPADEDDQGRVVINTGASKTHTTPDATAVGAPFAYVVQNNHATSNLTVEGNGSQTINGEANIALIPGGGGVLITNGTNWFFFGYGVDDKFPPPFVAGTKLVFAQAAAPDGWTQVTDHDDVMMRVVDGAGGGTGGSWTITGLAADAHTHTPGTLGGTTGSAGSGFGVQGGGANGVAQSHAHAFDVTTGVTGTASTTGVTHTPGWRPAYVDVIICEKD